VRGRYLGRSPNGPDFAIHGKRHPRAVSTADLAFNEPISTITPFCR
jgi:hypothetical protein